MPYIKGEERRYELQTGALPETDGELAYALTVHVLRYMRSLQVNFENINAVVGVLDNVKDEFKHRVLRPYEEHKRIENGDVF